MTTADTVTHLSLSQFIKRLQEMPGSGYGVTVKDTNGRSFQMVKMTYTREVLIDGTEGISVELQIKQVP